MASYRSTDINEVVPIAAAAIGTAAPAGAEVGWDPATGAQFYVDAAGLWQAVPVTTVDINSTVSNQTGANYGGGAPVAPPAAPDDGDVHIETYDDRTVYWVAAGGAFPAAPSAQFLAGVSTFADNGDGSVTHNDGQGTAVTVALCDLLDDVAAAAGATTDQYLVLQAGGACALVPRPGGAETPGGVAYPDATGNGIPEIGLEDQDGTVLPGFDTATGEWNVPVDRVADLGGAAPAAPTQETGMAFASYDLITLNGTNYVEDTYVWDPATAAYVRVLHPERDVVIDSDAQDAGTATAIGFHPATPLCAGDGSLTAAWVTADGTGLTAPVTINVIAGGAIVGTAIIPAGQSANTPVAATIAAAPVALAANSTGTFTVLGNGTAGESISDIAVTFSFKC